MNNHSPHTIAHFIAAISACGWSLSQDLIVRGTQRVYFRWAFLAWYWTGRLPEWAKENTPC